MSPAPCADAMRKDQIVSSRKPTRIPPQRGCRWRTSRSVPSPRSSPADDPLERLGRQQLPQRRGRQRRRRRPPARGPSASGTRRATPRAGPASCIPSATAKSQPIPGLRPCAAPSGEQRQPGPGHRRAQVSSGVAERVGGRVTALQPHLVRPQPVLELDEEARSRRSRRPAPRRASPSSRGCRRDRTARPTACTASW